MNKAAYTSGTIYLLDKKELESLFSKHKIKNNHAKIKGNKFFLYSENTLVKGIAEHIDRPTKDQMKAAIKAMQKDIKSAANTINDLRHGVEGRLFEQEINYGFDGKKYFVFDFAAMQPKFEDLVKLVISYGKADNAIRKMIKPEYNDAMSKLEKNIVNINSNVKTFVEGKTLDEALDFATKIYAACIPLKDLYQK